ncbi:hypothetical protein GUJ93_ZPchr0009g594 [Zizania palustris]|uniref:Uncharacterized protein n=1 Tax=Zizania palustris TaxID=103762 RepID=A0A8J5S3N2_ZIZPA|nr:hypothetical protein GUJ93_ZPchr0009g594 [Zizania palustris]
MVDDEWERKTSNSSSPFSHSHGFVSVYYFSLLLLLLLLLPLVQLPRRSRRPRLLFLGRRIREGVLAAGTGEDLRSGRRRPLSVCLRGAGGGGGGARRSCLSGRSAPFGPSKAPPLSRWRSGRVFLGFTHRRVRRGGSVTARAR